MSEENLTENSRIEQEAGEAFPEGNEKRQESPETEWKDLEEDHEKGSLWNALTYGVVIVLVVLLCALVWALTHRNRGGDAPVDAGSTVGAESGAGTEGIVNGGSGAGIDGISNGGSGAGTDGISNGGSGAGNDGAANGGSGAGTDGISNVGSGAGNEGTANGGSAADTGNGNSEANGIQGASGPGSGTSAPAENGPGSEPVSGDSSMTFQTVSETVTAKDVTNLRSGPSTADADNVLAQLLNGDALTRTGINADTGWSRLLWNDREVYAVTQYLTTDLDYRPPVAQGDPNRVATMDGRVIIFVDCDDIVTPKEYVNLRIEPSTSQGEDTVRAQLQGGEQARRTGYSPDAGWSRVEYNGEVLYVVSSYVVPVQ